MQVEELGRQRGTAIYRRLGTVGVSKVSDALVCNDD